MLSPFPVLHFSVLNSFVPIPCPSFPSVRQAVDQGFSRAFMTILDCHVTTLVSAFFLFSYGTQTVKGFAVTLTIGIIVSMFTAVFVSRVIYQIVLGEGRPVEALSI